jgi:hypothetical protein
MSWPIQNEIPLQGEGEQSTKFGGPWPYALQPPLCCTWENEFPPLGAGLGGAGLGGGGVELELEVVDVVLLLLGPGVLVELEVLEVEAPLLEEVPELGIALELALGSELPEHPLNRSIHDRRVTTAAH